MNQSILGLTYDYIKENDTYLIITREAPLQSHELEPIQVNMLKATVIPKLLPLEIEEMDLTIKFRYNISSRRMLSHSLKTNKITIKDYFNMLYHIACILDDCKIYMLCERNFILNDHFIFVGNDYSDIHLTYLPLKTIINKERLNDELRTLAIALIPSIDELKGDGIQELINYMGNEQFAVSSFKLKLMNLINEQADKFDRLDEIDLAQITLDKGVEEYPNSKNGNEASWLPLFLQRFFVRFRRRTIKPNDVTVVNEEMVYYQVNHDIDNNYYRNESNLHLLTGVDATVLLSDPPIPTMNAGDYEKTPFLLFNQGKETEQFDITEDNFIIGRGPADVGFALDHIGVSRCHAEIIKIGPQYCLKDLGSKNGTFLNDAQLIPYKIYHVNDKDIIRIIKTELVFRMSG